MSDEFALTTAERALLTALNALGIRYLVVGMGAALLEGAAGTTQDLDLWFGSIDKDLAQLPQLDAALAARGARGD